MIVFIAFVFFISSLYDLLAISASIGYYGKVRKIFVAFVIITLFFAATQKVLATHQEQLALPSTIEANDSMLINYSHFTSGRCYVIKIYYPLGNIQEYPVTRGDTITGTCSNDVDSFFSSTELGESGTIPLSTKNLGPANYQLKLYRKVCNISGSSCELRLRQTAPFSIQSFNSNCYANISPTNGLVEQTAFTILVIGRFIGTIDRITLQLINAQSGDPLESPFTVPLIAVSGSTDRMTGTVPFGPLHSVGQYNFAVLAPRTPGGGLEQICTSNTLSVDVDPASPPVTTCMPPDINPTTTQCLDTRCRVTSSGTCELPYGVLPTSVPTFTPTPFPTIPTFNPVDCKGDANCQACVESQEKPQGVWTGVGCIKTSPAGFIKSIFGIVLGLAGGIALILIIYSGYKMVMSSGNPETLQGARETLTSAIVGLLFIIFSFVILEIIGVDILQIPGFKP